MFIERRFYNACDEIPRGRAAVIDTGTSHAVPQVLAATWITLEARGS